MTTNGSESVNPRKCTQHLDGRGRGRTSQAKQRQLHALQLRRAGLTYQAIADRLGYRSKHGAWKAVQKALDTARHDLAHEVLQLELLRLDQLTASAYPAAITGNLHAIDAVLKIMDRRTRLLGLDRPRAGQHEQDGIDLLKSLSKQLTNIPDTYEPEENADAH